MRSWREGENRADNDAGWSFTERAVIGGGPGSGLGRSIGGAGKASLLLEESGLVITVVGREDNSMP